LPTCLTTEGVGGRRQHARGFGDEHSIANSTDQLIRVRSTDRELDPSGTTLTVDNDSLTVNGTAGGNNTVTLDLRQCSTSWRHESAKRKNLSRFATMMPLTVPCITVSIPHKRI